MIRVWLGVFLSCSMMWAGEMIAAVAANVSYAIEPLKKEFSRTHPDTTIQVILGSSGKLTAQIKNGAPYDLFMAANMKYPRALQKDGLAITEPVVYAQGALALLSVRKLRMDGSLKALADSRIDKISLANPKTAPYGKAAIEAFQKAGIYETILPRLVYAETVTQSVQFALSAVDVGVVAKSTLYSDRMKRFKEGSAWVSVDPSLYTPIQQGIVILRQAEGNKEVRAFYDFMFSREAHKILQDYGYLLP